MNCNIIPTSANATLFSLLIFLTSFGYMSSLTINLYQCIRIQSISIAFTQWAKVFSASEAFRFSSHLMTYRTSRKNDESHLEGITCVVYPIPLIESLPNETLTINLPSFLFGIIGHHRS